MVCKKIIEILQQQSPEGYACQWDNVGLLVGSKEQEIKHIYVSVDATDEVIAQAIEEKADLLITHHPLIFKGLKKINDENFISRRVIELIKNDIVYYAMHTNFDIVGMADLAAERMQLQQAEVLQVTTSTVAGEVLGIGKVGDLSDEMTLEACVELTKKAFEVGEVKVYGYEAYKEKMVKRIAICPGSGKSVVEDAIQAGAEVLITGDIDHHEGIDAAARGMTVIDAGHYGIEKIFVPYIKDYLEKQMPEVKITAAAEREPFIYL